MCVHSRDILEHDDLILYLTLRHSRTRACHRDVTEHDNSRRYAAHSTFKTFRKIFSPGHSRTKPHVLGTFENTAVLEHDDFVQTHRFLILLLKTQECFYHVFKVELHLHILERPNGAACLGQRSTKTLQVELKHVPEPSHSRVKPLKPIYGEL